MLEKIKALAQEQGSYMTELRHHFHAHPERAWQEIETTRRIHRELEAAGCKIVRTGFGGTESGVLAEIEGGTPGKCVLLRADIDALPLQDEKTVPWKSTVAGTAHACGHDAHTAMLLGAARVLAQIKSGLKGKVRLIFQPAEESGEKSGAKTLVAEGVLDGVDAAFGMHVMPILPAGDLGYRAGPAMAAGTVWELTVNGKGAHGSTPEAGVDPTIVTAQILSAFQMIVAREVSPRDTAVISSGGMKSSSFVFNIIPDRVDLCGTVRTFRPEVLDHIESAMRRMAEGIARDYRATADFRFIRFLPATVNDPALTKLAQGVGETLMGAEHVRELELNMGSEDFSYFGQKVPSVFLFLGSGNAAKKADFPNHSPHFDVDDTVYPNGAALHAGFAWSFLQNAN